MLNINEACSCVIFFLYAADYPLATSCELSVVIIIIYSLFVYIDGMSVENRLVMFFPRKKCFSLLWKRENINFPVGKNIPEIDRSEFLVHLAFSSKFIVNLCGIFKFRFS